jgi:hypothetical protein
LQERNQEKLIEIQSDVTIMLDDKDGGTSEIASFYTHGIPTTVSQEEFNLLKIWNAAPSYFIFDIAVTAVTATANTTLTTPLSEQSVLIIAIVSCICILVGFALVFLLISFVIGAKGGPNIFIDRNGDSDTQKVSYED